jgi:hypothetical protein
MSRVFMCTALLLTTMVAVAAEAGVLGPKKPSDLAVTAGSGGPSGGPCGSDFGGSGVLVNEGFTTQLSIGLPSGYVFVVQRLHTRITAGTAGATYALYFGRAGASQASRNVTLDAHGNADFDFEFGDGLVFHSLDELCVDQYAPGGGAGYQEDRAYGYVTKDK